MSFSFFPSKKPRAICKSSLLTELESLESRVLMSSNVTVNAGTVIRDVDSQLSGVNIAWWDSHLNTSQTAQLVQAAGLTQFRLPGGSSSDEYHFNVLGPSWEPTTAEFAQFIESVNGGGM